MRPALTAAVVALACGLAFAIGWSLAGGDAGPALSSAPSARSTADPATDELAVQLAEERSAREALALEVEGLSLELAALRAEALGVAGAAAPQAAEGDEALSRRDRAHAAGEIWFDESRLVASGLRPADAEILRELYEEIQLERLYARDAAAREGWPGQRLRQEFRALDGRIAAVRDEWGEDTYDWFLYAADRTNRVEIESVLGGSPASEAGVRPGDVILSYAGHRIYTPAELRQATTQGSLGEVVALEVVSGGRTRRLDVPRGPLGVRLDARSVPPG